MNILTKDNLMAFRCSSVQFSYGRRQRRTKEPLDESERGVKKLATSAIVV